MPRFPCAARAWPDAGFAQALKAEIENAPSGTLPLQQAVTQGGYVDDGAITATVIQSADAGDAVEAKVGVFFTEVVASCGCGEEPMPTNAYCVLGFRIDKETGAASVSVLDD
ncbi:MAG TPA: glucosamine--fructose-6-phosphate aminotransferase [Gammaproteobacteria bacterium]|nr:glucosamine--fructose-6-phosphate aminotransferase [Gammaproteobacteria bacterium]